MSQRMSVKLTHVNERQLASLTAMLASEEMLAHAEGSLRFDPEDGSGWVATLPWAYLVEVKRDGELPRTNTVLLLVIRVELTPLRRASHDTISEKPVRIDERTFLKIIRSLGLFKQ